MAGAILLRRAALVAPGFGLAGWVAVDERPKEFALKTALLPMRLARDVKTALLCVADYTWSLHGLEGEAREAAKQQCHLRGAQRLLDLCFANQGIYIKLSQHIAMLDHLLPSEYVLTLRAHTLDRCPVSSREQVEAVIREDLGASVDQLFAEFSPEPIASASLAQVHVARDHDGRRLAVKVQHRGLREMSQVDLTTIDWLVWAIKQIAPDFDYGWLVDEAKHNLPLELNFLHEAANAERCRAKLTSRDCRVRGRVVVPAIDPTRTSTRVLTMEFIDGVKVTDRAGLQRLKAAPADVAKLISQTFNEMIFSWGDVHVDPHAANLLVRATPAPASWWRGWLPRWLGGNGSSRSSSGMWGREAGPNTGWPWQLVLLDHGLYRQLDDHLRLEYAGLWHSLIFADEEGIMRHSEALNAGSAYQLFAGMLTQRPWEQITQKKRTAESRLTLKYTAEERAEIQDYAAQYAREIGDLLLRMPRPLLLLLKTNDCLRAVDLELGAGVSNFVTTARECQRALAADRLARSPGLLTRLSCAREAAQVELCMAALRGMTWLAEMEAWLQGNASSGNGSSDTPAAVA